MNVTGQTALITGASSGIGEAYAREFAARGADLILVARSESRLRELADQLGSRYGRKVTVLPADLQVAGAGDALARQVDDLGLTVDILINNAGFGMHGQLAEADPDRLTALIQLNCVSLVDITRRFLPGMMARRRGTVINIASTAAFQPLPFMAAYGASKAFVLSFTEALWAEARPAGVKVIAVCPGATETRFFDVVGTEAASVGARRTPEQVVATTFAALRRGRPSVVDGRANALLAKTPGLSPRRMVIRIAERTMRAQ